MKTKLYRFIAAAVSAAAIFSWVSPQAAAQTREQRLKDHVYYFASDSLLGRKAGSENAAKAADYIVSQYESLGMKPFFEDGWKARFQRDERIYTNVVGIIEGNDPVLKNEYIVLGAHYDHLGVNGKGEIFNGADDNASGSATLIEVARELVKNRQNLKRSVIIAAFDAEELGLYGSYALSNVLKDMDRLENVKLMVSIDMVGWLAQSGALKVEGTGTVLNGNKTLLDLASRNGIDLKLKKFETEVLTATDTQGFAEKGVATLDMTTGTKSPYHKPEDDADLIDYQGLDKVCSFVTDVTYAFASDAGFAPSGKVAPKHRPGVRTLAIGPSVGIGSTSFSFPESSLVTKSGFTYQAGLTAKVNFSKHLGLRADALFENSKSGFPVENDIYRSKGQFNQTAFCVPAYVLLQSESRLQRSFIGFGAYYRDVIKVKYSGNITNQLPVDGEQYGFAFTAGFGAGPYCLSVDIRTNKKMFKSSDINADMSICVATLSRWF